MTDYSAAEQVEHTKIRAEAFNYMAGVHPLSDHYSAVAHFVMRKLREERGYDFRAAEARALRQRLAEIDRQVMDGSEQ